MAVYPVKSRNYLTGQADNQVKERRLRNEFGAGLSAQSDWDLQELEERIALILHLRVIAVVVSGLPLRMPQVAQA